MKNPKGSLNISDSFRYYPRIVVMYKNEYSWGFIRSRNHSLERFHARTLSSVRMAFHLRSLVRDISERGIKSMVLAVFFQRLRRHYRGLRESLLELIGAMHRIASMKRTREGRERNREIVRENPIGSVAWFVSYRLDRNSRFRVIRNCVSRGRFHDLPTNNSRTNG